MNLSGSTKYIVNEKVSVPSNSVAFFQKLVNDVASKEAVGTSDLYRCREKVNPRIKCNDRTAYENLLSGHVQVG